MSNKFKDIDIKNLTYYFFNDIINIEHFDQNNIKIDEKLHENIFIYCIGYVTIKKYVKIYIVNSLYLIFKTSMVTFEEINKSKYSTLVPINESKEKIKKCVELSGKIRDLITSITKNSDDYDEKYMKIKFNSDVELPLNKTTEIPTITIVFHENNNIFHKNFQMKVCIKYKNKK